MERKQLDNKPGAGPLITIAKPGGVTFQFGIVGQPDSVTLLLRCSPDGNVFTSIKRVA